MTDRIEITQAVEEILSYFDSYRIGATAPIESVLRTVCQQAFEEAAGIADNTVSSLQLQAQRARDAGDDAKAHELETMVLNVKVIALSIRKRAIRTAAQKDTRIDG